MTDPDPVPDDAPADATLDPPGSIAVVGAGPLGIEAALYGRYLGYDVTLFERRQVADHWRSRAAEPLPLPSSRCWSPLAAAALEAQYPERFPAQGPLTIGQWVDQGLVDLLETDLLRGRLRAPAEVTRIDLAERVAADQGVAADRKTDSGQSVDPVGAATAEPSAAEEESPPPDFRLTVRVPTDPEADGGRPAETAEITADFEAVIVAVGVGEAPDYGFAIPTDYLFRVGERELSDAEESLREGFRQIVAIYAGLGGRSDLDLYRPRRV